MKRIALKICLAIKRGDIDPNHITPAGLRRIGINCGTSSTFLAKHKEKFIRIRRGVYRINENNEECKSFLLE